MDLEGKARRSYVQLCAISPRMPGDPPVRGSAMRGACVPTWCLCSCKFAQVVAGGGWGAGVSCLRKSLQQGSTTLACLLPEPFLGGSGAPLCNREDQTPITV